MDGCCEYAIKEGDAGFGAVPSRRRLGRGVVGLAMDATHVFRAIPAKCGVVWSREGGDSDGEEGGVAGAPGAAHSARRPLRAPARGESAMGEPSSMPLEPAKLLFLFLFLAIAGISNWAVIAFTHDFVPRGALPDVIFSLVPEQRWAALWGDFMVTSCLVSLFLLATFHKHRIVLVRRVVFCAATLYAMRSVSLFATQLPPGYEESEKRCRPYVNSSAAVFFSRLWEQTIRLGFQDKDDMLCGDLLFSGHTLVMITCTLSVNHYLPTKLKRLGLIPYVFSMFGMLCMIISRTHYTVDVVFAYWLSQGVFRLYHAYCEVDVCLDRRSSVLHGLWLLRIVDWLEENIVPGRLENKLEVPFSDFIHSVLLNRAPGHHKQISISSASTFGLP